MQGTRIWANTESRRLKKQDTPRRGQAGAVQERIVQIVSPKSAEVVLDSVVLEGDASPTPEPRSLGVYVIAAGAAVTLGWVGALLYGAAMLVGHVFGAL